MNPQPIKIPITARLRSYLDLLEKPDNQYVFGFIKEVASESQIINKKEKDGKMISKHLEEFTQRLKLSVLLRTNTVRNAYATRLKKGDVSIVKIAEMFTQTSSAVIRRYLDLFDQDVHKLNNILP